MMVFWDVTVCCILCGHQTAWCHTPEPHNLDTHCYKKFISYKIIYSQNLVSVAISPSLQQKFMHNV